MTQEYPKLNIVGEEWSSNPSTVAYWQRGRNPPDGYVSYLPSLFDFPLQEAVAMGLKEPEGWGTGLRRIYKVLAQDSVYADPYNLVVFHDNHDMSRMFTALGERRDLDRMALAFVLTTRGIPQLFYGTEVLMSNKGTEDHGVIRSDFPGGWAGDAKNAFTGTGAQRRRARDAGVHAEAAAVASHGTGHSRRQAACSTSRPTACTCTSAATTRRRSW